MMQRKFQSLNQTIRDVNMSDISEWYNKLKVKALRFPTDLSEDFTNRLLNPFADIDAPPVATSVTPQTVDKEDKPLPALTGAKTQWAIFVFVCLFVFLLIFGIVFLAYSIKPESFECHVSFPEDRNFPFIRSPHKRGGTDTITYFCNDLPDAPVFEVWECQEGEWELKEQSECECFETPPPPVPPNVYDWKPNDSEIALGTVVKYFCLAEFKERNEPFEHLQCVNNRTWSIIQQLSSCDNITALCRNEPPEFHDKTLRHWNYVWYRVGTIIPYYCSNNSNSQIKMVFVCDVYLNWTKVLENQCDCLDDPPLPTRNIYREWDGSHSSGTIATYFCEPNFNASILLTYVCDDSEWKRVFRAACRIEKFCVSLPPFPKQQGIIRQVGNRGQIGSSLVYFCDDKQDSKIYRTVVCNAFRKWEIVFENNCTEVSCKPIQETEKPTYLSSSLNKHHILGRTSNIVGAGIIQSCVPQTHLFQLTPFRQSAVCMDDGNWKIVTSKSCATTLPNTECSEFIPKGPPATFLSWQLKQRILGSTVQYLCARHTKAVIAASYVCSDYGKWASTQPVIPCLCPDKPPLPNSYLYRIVKPKTHCVDSQYLVYCNFNPGSPIFMIITCTPQLIWKTDELSLCTCSRPPPPEWPLTGSWNSKISFFHLGTRVTYFCNSEPKAPVAFILECKSKYISKAGRINVVDWEQIVCKDCPETPHECKQPPRSPPKFVQWDWTRNKTAPVGTLISYYCYQDRSRVWMTNLCTPKGLWEETYTPSSCGCYLDPPLPPPDIYRLWDGNSRFGSVAYYTCIGVAKKRILRTLICNAEGVWAQAFRGSCRLRDYACCIYNHPKIPKGREFVMWKNTNTSGSTIQIFCPKKTDLEESEQTVERIYVCEAATLKWKLVSKSNCPCDDPPFYPMNSRTVNMLMRWKSHSTIGSVVKYICHPSRCAASPGVIIQCLNSTWTQIFRGACSCFNEPKPPSPYSVRIWDKTSYICSNITYRCSDDKGAPIEQIFICNTNGQWFPQIRKPNTNCDCGDPPQPPVPVTWSWEGNTRHMGVIIKYHCNHDPKSPQIVAIKCMADLKWNVISTFNWTKDLIKFKESVKYSHYHVASSIKPISAKAGRLDIGKMTNVCYNAAPVGSEFKKRDWGRLMTCRCDCLDDPPQYPDPIISNWKRSNALNYYYGTIVTFWCSENSEAYITIVCREDRLWRPKKSTPYNDCKCKGKLEEIAAFSQYPVYREWPGLSRHLGIRVEYRCSQSEHAPVLTQYECVYSHETKQNEWFKVIDRSLAVCICTCSLPPAPLRSPPLQIVSQWTYGENENELALWSGSRYEYRCGNNVLAGIYQIVECGGDSCWHVVDFTGKCEECQGDPPTGPGIRNWDGSRLVGTIAVYQCTTDIHSMHAMDYECSYETHQWVRVYNGSCECRAFPEPAPPPLKLQVDWLSPMCRQIGIRHAVTCSKDENSPIVDMIECGPEGTWIRLKNPTPWSTLIKEFCACQPPPEISPHYNKQVSYTIGDQITYYCGFEPDAAPRRIMTCSNQRLWMQMMDNPHACMCLNNPPSAEGKGFRSWNGSKEIGTEIHYRCNIHLPYVKEILQCKSNGEWEIIMFDEAACVCVDNKPVLPAGKDQADLRWDHEVGVEGNVVIIRLHCNAYNSSPIFAEIVCNRRGEWSVNRPAKLIGNMIDDHFWNITYAESCYCTDDKTLPKYDNITVFTIEPLQRVIGSHVSYSCDETDNEKFLQKFECNEDLKWVEVDLPDSQKCSCAEEPPPVPKYTTVFREWDFKRFYGTEVIYYCTKEKKTIFQIVQCGSDGIWNYTLPPNPMATCSCEDPPPAEPGHRREWQGSDVTGSKATYMCSDNANDTILYNHAYRVYECSMKRQWDLVLDEDCQCPRELPASSAKYADVLSRVKHPPHRQVGGQIHGKCPNSKSAGDMLIYTCHTNMTWLENEGVEELIKKICYCTGDLPEKLDVYPVPFMNRTGENEIGASIDFHCSTAQSPVYETYNCTSDGKWTKSSPLDDMYLYNIKCHCTPPPPLPKHKPRLVRVEKDIKTTIGSKFSEQCSNDSSAPLYATYECTATRTWKKTPVTSCDCDGLPSGFPDTIYADWKNPTPPGGNLTYSCSEFGGYIATYTCTEGLTWRLTHSVHEEEWELPDFVETYCKCEKPFPDLGGEYVIDHQWNQSIWKSIDKLDIRCSPLSSVVVGHLVCMSAGDWKPKPPLTNDTCSCKVEDMSKPSEPYYLKEPLNETVQAPKHVIFYCSDKEPLNYKYIVQCLDPDYWIVRLEEAACECSTDTIEGLPEEFKLQDGPEEYEVGTSVEVECVGLNNTIPVNRFWCSQNGEWILETETPWDKIADEYCECPDPPRAPTGLSLLPEPDAISRKVGSAVYHQCTLNPAYGTSKTFICTEKEDEYGLYWKHTENSTCKCEGEPAGGAELNDWNQWQNRVGTVVHYHCGESLDTPVKYRITCNKTDPDGPPKWERDAKDSVCSCDDEPTYPETPEFHVHYPEGRFVGSTAKLTCSDDPNSTAIALFYCTDEGEWISDVREEKKLDKTICQCPPFKNPHKNFPIVEFEPNEDEKKHLVGAEATVFCSEGHEPFIAKYKCNSDKKWEEIASDKCECPPLPEVPEPQKIYPNKDSKNPLAIGQSHPVTCNDMNKLAFHNHIICTADKEWEFELPHLCYCSTPPPPPTSSKLHLQWNELQIEGTVANYTCAALRTSPIVVSVTCKFGDKWEKSTEDDEDSLAETECTCLSDPPTAEPHLNRVWNPEDKHIGQEARYECTTGSVDYVYRCNMKRQWDKISMGFCECRTDLPALPPAVSIVSSKYQGAVAHFLCTSDPKQGLFRDYRCSTDNRWELTKEYSCACKEPAPTSPNGIYHYDVSVVSTTDEYYVGSERRYFCSDLPNSKMIRKAECVSPSARSDKEWEFKDKNISTWDELTEECKCLANPPRPFHNAGWDWDQERQEGHVVKYYCLHNSRIGPVIATATCNAQQEWELDSTKTWQELLESECICNEPPELPIEDVIMAWESIEPYRIGSVMAYWCDKEAGKFHVKYQCDENRDWVVKEIGKCDNEYCSIHHDSTHVMCLSVVYKPLVFADQEMSCKLQDSSVVQLRTKDDTEKTVKCSYTTPSPCKYFFFNAHYSNKTIARVNQAIGNATGHLDWVRQHEPDEDCAMFDEEGKAHPAKCDDENCVVCEYPAANNLYFNCDKFRNN